MNSLIALTVAALAAMVPASNAFTISHVIVSSDLTRNESLLEAALTNASAAWGDMIRSEFDDLTFTSSVSLSDYCDVDYTFTSGDVITDLLVLVQIIDGDTAMRDIDAAPCVFSDVGDDDSVYLPRVSVLSFTLDAIETIIDGGFIATMMEHEFGHLLGLNTLWSTNGLISNSTYTGTYGIEGYIEVGGNETETSVPLETDDYDGVHWDELTFDTEIMTGHLDGRVRPISILSVWALKDLGYSVWLQNAEEEWLPTSVKGGNSNGKGEKGMGLYGDYVDVDFTSEVAVFADGTISLTTITSTTTTTSDDDDDDTTPYVNTDFPYNTLTDYADTIQTALDSAASKWNDVIRTELDDIVFEYDTTLPTSCGIDYTINAGTTIQNLLVILQVVEGGSVDKVLQSNPCIFAESDDGTYFPRVGVITLDADNFTGYIEKGSTFLEDFFVHEIAHVLGVGTMWKPYHLLDGSDYNGDAGVWGYKQVGGALSVESVPIEVDEWGTRHWDETYFDNEVLSGHIDGRSRPLSLLTVNSLRDIGYEIYVLNADDYDMDDSKHTNTGSGTSNGRNSRGLGAYDDYTPLSESAKVYVFADGSVKQKQVDFAAAHFHGGPSPWELGMTVVGAVFILSTLVLATILCCRCWKRKQIDATQTEVGSVPPKTVEMEQELSDRAMRVV